MALKDFNPSGPKDPNYQGSGTGNANGSAGGNPNGSIPAGMGGIPFFAPDMDDDDFDPNEYLINYNEKHQYDAPIMFRDNIVQQTMSCLIGKFKPNALLVGAAGVGKN